MAISVYCRSPFHSLKPKYVLHVNDIFSNWNKHTISFPDTTNHSSGSHMIHKWLAPPMTTKDVLLACVMTFVSDSYSTVAYCSSKNYGREDKYVLLWFAFWNNHFAILFLDYWDSNQIKEQFIIDLGSLKLKNIQKCEIFEIFYSSKKNPLPWDTTKGI